MKPGELISVQHDQNRRGLPKESTERKSGARTSQASVWQARPSVDFPAPQFWGAYPKDFIKWACRAMRCDRQSIVHFCAGALPAGEGYRIDIRPETNPDLVADCRALPLEDCSVGGAVLIDPPYSVEYAKDLYGTEYPRPSALLAEASRITKPGAAIGMLHFLVPLPPAGTAIEHVYGVTTGPNYRIRAFTIFRRAQQDLGFTRQSEGGK